MDLSKGFHKEVIEARENKLDFENDNLKSTVSTSPLKSGGASFKTNVLIEVSPSKLVYKPSIGVALFCFLFLAIGLAFMFFSIYPLFENNPDLGTVKWFVLIFGLIFASAGGFMFYYFYKPRVFDKQFGLYYRTYSFKLHESNRKENENHISLKSIIAIQIIGEHVKSDKGYYKSFELNLVLEDSSRKNVVDYGNLKSIINDAEILSNFLNVPIWHAGSLHD